MFMGTDSLRVACPMLLYPTRVCAVSRLARLLPGSVISVHRSSIVSYSDPYGRDMKAGRQGTVGEIGLETGEAAYLLDSQRKNE